MRISTVHTIILCALAGVCPLYAQTAAGIAPDAPAAVFPKRSVALAFLGSRRKFKTVIAPLLQKYHFHATLFIDDPPLPPVVDDIGIGKWYMTSDGIREEWNVYDLGTEMRHMTSDEIREVSNVFEIGNFTSHPETEAGAWIDWPRPQQIRQLGVVEKRCESAGVSKPALLFYPGGMADAGIFQLLAEKGYSMGVTRLPPGIIDFYQPAIHHPFLIPSLMDTRYFYKACDMARSPGFPQDRILVLAFDCSPTILGWGTIEAYLQFLHDRQFNVLSIGDLAAYANAGEALRAKRFWDMRYAQGGGTGIVFTQDPRTQHWYMEKIAPVVPAARSAGSAPLEPAHAPTPLEVQLERRMAPKVDFKQAPLKECIEALREAGAGGNAPPVNFIIASGVDDSTPITLHLQNVPLMEAIRYVADLAGAAPAVDDYAVTISPRKNPGRRVAKTPATYLQIAALESLRLPEVRMNGSTLGSALEALHRQAQTVSTASVPEFVFNPEVDLSTTVSLHLLGASYLEVLRYISFLAGVRFAVDRYAVSVLAGANRGALDEITPASMGESADLATANISELNFTDASLDAVMELLTQRLAAATGGMYRLTFVAEPSLNLSKPVTLHVKNMPFTAALRYVGDLANADFRIERYAIIARRKVTPAAEPAPAVYAAPTPFALVQ